MAVSHEPCATLPGLIAADLAAVRQSMQAAVAGIPEEMGQTIRDQVEHAGKLLRPRFFLGACRMFCPPGSGGDLPEGAYRMAASLELLHLATLLHDDILDEAAVRRGRPTLFALKGAKRSVLAGDLILTCAASHSADLMPPGDYVALTRGLAGICKGEVLQLRRQDLQAPSQRLYARQIGAKTALLFSLSFRAGAQAAGAGLADALRLQRAGYQVGMAFQLVDDILDLAPDGLASGKSAGRDIPAGLVTGPVLHALGQGPARDGVPEAGRQQAALRRALGRRLGRQPGWGRGTARLTRLVEQLGGIAAARSQADRYLERSRAILAAYPDSAGRSILLDLLAGLNGRKT